MRERFLSVREVADQLERHDDRILDAIALGELPYVWSGRERVIPSWALPPYQRVSEEEG